MEIANVVGWLADLALTATAIPSWIVTAVTPMFPEQHPLIQWFFNLPWGPTVRQSTWIFAAAETMHFVGLCVMLGALVLVDLRLIGFMRQIPVKAVLPYVSWAVGGFLVVVATGLVFLASNPMRYFNNWDFLIKMMVLGLAGANALVFTVVEHRKMAALGPGEDTPTFTKVTAGVSLGLWSLVLLFGRLIPVYDF